MMNRRIGTVASQAGPDDDGICGERQYMDANLTLMIREAQLAESQLHSQHYLKSVTTLGDRQQVYATCDIYSSSGVKLLNAGALVNSAIYERLLHHKLIPTLDESLMTEGGVTIQSLLDEATLLMGFDAGLLRMRAAMPDDRMLGDILAHISLNLVLAFKLTVMRSTRKELFQRSLYVALVAIYIGIQSELDRQQLVQLATAALLHDIGLLHVDPAMLEIAYRMSEEERRHLYAHPITAWIILRETPEYSAQVAEAVLHHHERLDGSGYPQGLAGDEISQYGQIIAMAEVVASRFGKADTHQHLMRLETILKLNSRRYGRNLIGHLKMFYTTHAEYPQLTEEEKQLVRQNLNVFADVLKSWESMRERFVANSLSAFINERMQALKIEALDAGLNPYVLENPMQDTADNSEAFAELSILLDEIIWQVKGILQEIRRRWPRIDQDDSSHGAESILLWISTVENRMGQAH